eukprot:gene27340-biopygen9856
MGSASLMYPGPAVAGVGWGWVGVGVPVSDAGVCLGVVSGCCCGACFWVHLVALTCVSSSGLGGGLAFTPRRHVFLDQTSRPFLRPAGEHSIELRVECAEHLDSTATYEWPNAATTDGPNGGMHSPMRLSVYLNAIELGLTQA